jgi:hypothetical protein
MKEEIEAVVENVVEAVIETIVKDGTKYCPKSIFSYDNATFEAGYVEGHPHDTIYFKVDKPHREGEAGLYYKILLKPNEAAALIWALSSVMMYALEDESLCSDVEQHNKCKFQLLKWIDKRRHK